MLRLLTAAVLAGSLLAPARAADDKEKEPKKLAAGDPAPPLKADKWMHGAEVKSFEPGKVYVVEFWATWCGPCIVMMPHLGELQTQLRDKGVTIIGHTSKDSNGNTEEKVAEFVQKRGAKLGYTFAFQTSRESYEAWMKAAGQQGIPCSFVVDKAGKIAYIGHPMYLDAVLPKVIDGSWNPAKGKDEVAAIEKMVDATFESLENKDPEVGLGKLAALEKAHPGMGNIPYFVGPRLGLLAKAKKYTELREAAEAQVAKATKNEDASGLAGVAMTLTSPELKEQKELVAIGVKAAEAMVASAGEKDLRALVTAARALDAAGEKAKAKGYAEKAVAAAPNADVKKQVEQVLKPILDGEKKDGK